MRSMGLEPTRLAAQEPKSWVSTNSTIPAYLFFSLFLLGGIPEAEHSACPPFIKTGHTCFYLVNGKFFTVVTPPKSGSVLRPPDVPAGSTRRPPAPARPACRPVCCTPAPRPALRGEIGGVQFWAWERRGLLAAPLWAVFSCPYVSLFPAVFLCVPFPAADLVFEKM